MERDILKWEVSQLRTIFLSPTNVCNYLCTMCFNQLAPAPRGFLSWDLFQRIIHELAAIRAIPASQLSELHFYLDGEPFLHRQYVEMLKYIDEHISGFRVVVSTNGALLTPDKTDVLLNLHSNSYIYILSLDASNQELYDAVKPRSNFERTDANTRYFLSRKQELGIRNPHVALQFVVMSINEHDMGAFYEKWDPLLGPKVKAAYQLWSDDILRESGSHIYWKRFHCRSDPFRSDHGLYSGHFGNSPVNGSEPLICAWPWRILAIGWNGGLHPCCFFPESKSMLGNIQGRSIQEVFEGERQREMRRLFLERKVHDIPVCRDCPKRAWWHDVELEESLGIR